MKIVRLNGEKATRDEALALLKRAATELLSLSITERWTSDMPERDTTEGVYLDRAVQCLEDARVRLINSGKG